MQSCKVLLCAAGTVVFGLLAEAGDQGGAKAQVAGAPVQVDQLVVRMLLPRARGAEVFTLHFTAPAEATEEGRWFHGTGSAAAENGDVVCPTMNVKLLVTSSTEPSRTIEREDGAFTYFSDPKSPVSVIHYAPAPSDTTRFAVVVSHVQQNAATVTLEGPWSRVGGLPSMSAVLAELYRLLTLDHASGPDSHAGCDPSLEQCFQAAKLACGDAGIESFGYSCNSQTGEATCEFTCYAQGGGG